MLGVQDTRHRPGHHGPRCGLQIKSLVDLAADPFPHVTGPSGIGCSSEKAAKEARETSRLHALVSSPRFEDPSCLGSISSDNISVQYLCLTTSDPLI